MVMAAQFMDQGEFYASPQVPTGVANCLREAAAAYADTDTAEPLLWQAQALAPDCLTVYFALYKFYFYKGRLRDAERVTRLGLATAARLGGIDADWSRLTPDSGTDWQKSDSPQHFYLAFICLRQGERADSLAILDKLAELDPMDRVGASVIRALAGGSASSLRQ
jgi:tetratricopeptide (TPR) repeat protein